MQIQGQGEADDGRVDSVASEPVLGSRRRFGRSAGAEVDRDTRLFRGCLRANADRRRRGTEFY